MRFVDKRWALLPVRLMIGFGFAAHGYAKLTRGPDKFAIILEALGLPQPHLMAWMTTLLELVGGVSVMAGAFVVPVTVPLSVVMMTARGSSSVWVFIHQTKIHHGCGGRIWSRRI
jgi:uncharacterized membrane protein YphA (DoxX/SURF4 family)